MYLEIVNASADVHQSEREIRLPLKHVHADVHHIQFEIKSPERTDGLIAERKVGVKVDNRLFLYKSLLSFPCSRLMHQTERTDEKNKKTRE